MATNELLLERLKALPFVTAITLDESVAATVVRTPAGPFELDVRIERSFLSSRGVDELVAAPRERPLLLLAPLVAGDTAERLKSAGVNFLDDAGNLHLSLGDHYMALVEGKTLRLRSDHRGSARRATGMPTGGLEVLERMVGALGADRFAWGGGVAARRLGGSFTGERVTLHVRDQGVELPLAPAPDGQVYLLGIPGPLAWYADNEVWDGNGVRAVNPLLAYAELVDQRGDRAFEAAATLRDEWLDLS